MASKIENTRFWQASSLGGVELLHAQYYQQRFTPHVHDSFVISVIESGAQRFRHRGSEHVAPIGSVVLINPDELHTGATAHNEGWRYRGFYPTLTQLAEVLAELELRFNGSPRFVSSVVTDSQVARAFSNVHSFAEHEASALLQQTAWREAALMLFQRHAGIGPVAAPGKEPVAVRRAREILLERLAFPPSLEELASSVGLSPFHFARVFRKATGLPPHSWVTQKRLACAQMLLKQGITPSRVAAELGFADQSHLTRQFKQAFGIGPGAYRSAVVR
ncbi:AraC family transcriptional regulator [Pseudomonas sp. AF32]|uniref:AraC family transcriptional regulator n=1 Tax=Pseudomonas sp. AF32 TaxID=554390 RepID=UPI001EED90E0|nr:AraC family transcriptional regulator [Pseudomonas sp. AF32]